VKDGLTDWASCRGPALAYVGHSNCGSGLVSPRFISLCLSIACCFICISLTGELNPLRRTQREGFM
jgi:hypothetical protein